MHRKNLLYLNLSVDDKDVSLGFAKTWTNQFSENFENVDIITLKKTAENTEYQNVKIYGISDDNKSTKFNKYIQIKNIIKKLTAETDYDLCFSHMSPLLLVLTKIYSKNKNTPRVLWYTHPKPKELSKRLILRLSLIFSNKVVTASKSSFPYKSKKVGIKPKVILSGRSLNDNMGNYYSNKFLNSLMKLKKINKESKILIMGLSFKENCNDIRNSKVFDIISRVSKNYKVRVFDPNVKNKNLFKKNKNVQMISSIKKNSFDGIILTVKHKEFAKLGLIKIKSFGKKDCIFYDIKNLFFDNKEPIKINDFI